MTARPVQAVSATGLLNNLMAASDILLHTQTAMPLAIGSREIRTLHAVSDALHDADAYRRFCEGTGTSAGADAKEDYELVARALRPAKDWLAAWKGVKSVACLMHTMADGQKPDTKAIVQAIELCTKILTGVAGPAVKGARPHAHTQPG